MEPHAFFIPSCHDPQIRAGAEIRNEPQKMQEKGQKNNLLLLIGPQPEQTVSQPAHALQTSQPAACSNAELRSQLGSYQMLTRTNAADQICTAPDKSQHGAKLESIKNAVTEGGRCSTFHSQSERSRPFLLEDGNHAGRY